MLQSWVQKVPSDTNSNDLSYCRIMAFDESCVLVRERFDIYLPKYRYHRKQKLWHVTIFHVTCHRNQKLSLTILCVTCHKNQKLTCRNIACDMSQKPKTVTYNIVCDMSQKPKTVKCCNIVTFHEVITDLSQYQEQRGPGNQLLELSTAMSFYSY